MSFDASTVPSEPAAIASESAAPQAPVNAASEMPAKPEPLPAPKPLPEAAPAAALTEHAASDEQAALAAKGTKVTPRAATPVHSLNAVKHEELLVQTAAKIRDYTAMGKSAEEALKHLQQEYAALAAALNPKGDAVKAASAALVASLNAQIADGHCHIPVSEAVKTMHGIFVKRQAEAQTSHALLADSAFIQQASAMAASGAPLKASHWFTDAKKEETIADLISDSPAHTLGNGMGQHFLHKALADVYRLDGPLQPALSKAIQQAAPTIAPDAVIAVAKNWLHARFHRADTIAAETKPGTGSLYLEAMKRTEAKLHANFAPAQIPSEIATQVNAELARISEQSAATPEAVTQTPAQHAGTVAQAPALSEQQAPAL